MQQMTGTEGHSPHSKRRPRLWIGVLTVFAVVFGFAFATGSPFAGANAVVPAGEPTIDTATFTLASDGQSMSYRVVARDIDSQIIGLRLHFTSTWPRPDGRRAPTVVGVLDHRNRTTLGDGSIELTGTFGQTDLAFFTPQRLADIINNDPDRPESDLHHDSIDVVIATTEFRSGAVGTPIPAVAAGSDPTPQTPRPVGDPRIESTTFTVAPDGLSMTYEVVARDIDEPITGLRLYPTSTWPSSDSTTRVIAVLDHSTRATQADGSIKFAGTFDTRRLPVSTNQPWSTIAELADTIDRGQVDVAVVTNRNRFGAAGINIGPVERSS